jgi:CheY-like chemotaxis protein
MATVLVVEDDQLSQRILGKILAGAGHETLHADSATKAWEQLRRHADVQLAILDNQLGGEWGWEFLQALRADPIHTGLPVVVYTAHTERSSILKYVELGVQAMLVKPYRGDAVLDEVKKAEAHDWGGRLLERPEAACARLKISESDYYSTLSASASALEKNLGALRDALAAKREEHAFKEPLQHILNQSAALGMPVLKTMVETFARGLGAKQTASQQGGLRGLESLQRLLHERALAYMRVKEMTVAARRGGAKTRRAPAKPIAPARNEAAGSAAAFQAAAFTRTTATAPVWALGRQLTRLEGRNFFADGELAALAAEWGRRAPFTALVEAHRFIASAPHASNEDVLAAVEATPDFKARFLKIAQRLGGGETEPPVGTDASAAALDAARALERLGVYRTIVLTAAARIAEATRRPSPLELTMLREHTLTVGILAYEIGRMLRLPDEHLPAAAGFAHDAGTWFFALAEPGLYALSLALAHEGGFGAARAEKGIWGMTHAEAGQLCLEAAHAPALLWQAVRTYEEPAHKTDAETKSLRACVYLADQLAWAASADEAHARAIRGELLLASNPAWAALEDADVPLPMDVPELLEAMASVAKTAAWLGEELA